MSGTGLSSGLSFAQGAVDDPLREITVGGALDLAAAAWGPRTALVEFGPGNAKRRWTFDELRLDGLRVARAMLERFRPGEHVAVWAANLPEWVLLEMGAAYAGLTLVTVNPAYQLGELTYVLGQSRCSGAIVQDTYRGRDLVPVVDEARPELPALRDVVALSGWDDFLASGDPSRELPPVEPGDTAQIQYTSGTTGTPKGAELTHRGLVNVARYTAMAKNAGPDDVWINPMPMFHTAGCGLATLGALQTGGTHVLPPEFDAAVMLDAVESERGTAVLSVPTMLIRMLDEQSARPRDVSSWRLSSLGGSPVPAELVRRAQRELDVVVTIGFGQTEASPYITHTVPDDPNPNWVTTVGRALPHWEVRISDPQSGATVPLGVVGEVCARGYGVMKGYFDAPEATAAAVDADGWLHTGDLGSMDDLGYLRIDGRLKDMIIRGGENIYPREIEDLLFTHPQVADVSVVGLPDPEMGETVAAFVRPVPGTNPSVDELVDFTRRHLARYKTPRVWQFVESFPQTTSGKIQKYVLRANYLAQHGAGHAE
ncbi:AMP-binding protein [Pseudonocardia alaniniphila]|uniref:AMP-binding protein n=1 Tax=Pseudonocardia alaniniphila TaxID=75291 RepID=A0ABS9TL88_9PSEU|nr:AMP-binding protein [Pseudonocardia alaniniphila]MCH6169306.1 AMP-binding protein [Pseudonocardia alaniniphila]